MATANRKKEIVTAKGQKCVQPVGPSATTFGKYCSTDSRRLIGLALALMILLSVVPAAHALPSFARQTGQRCSSCHVGVNWPQLTPWGRFFKLSGYTAGKSLFGGESGGLNYVPIGIFGQVGATWASQPNNSQGQPVVSPNGSLSAYEFTAEAGTKLTDFLGIFYEYQLGNTFPGWKGATGPADARAVHFFHPGGQELLVGIDSNNNPTVQDVWNTVPSWSYPYYVSPQALGGPASPMIASLGGQATSVGVYALLDRQVYAEVSVYRVATNFFRWMSAGTSFTGGGANYLDGFNPYWRVYWTKEHGPHVLMVGIFGMHSNVYPNSAAPTGPTNTFTDYGFDSQYEYLGGGNKVAVRFSYIFENQAWNASFPLGGSSTPNGNIQSLNLNGTYTLQDRWIFSAGYFANNGSNNAALYAVTSPSGSQLTASPNTTGYTLELDRTITQNLKLTMQYNGFFKFNGLTQNIDGMGRTPGDNNTLWLSLFMAF
jgi:hypothetical protein